MNGFLSMVARSGALLGGAERAQQGYAVLDGTVDQFEHLRHEFLHARGAEVRVEVFARVCQITVT
ncbi:hypothetical protein [Actinoplanes sp. M2I2]|uniref:hypothetical protein n=1 Tax=Actinoplanes sp. M2I2 TaxID=1734444 RepID=UPI002020E68A|nr:hypothetical protein [Actinoplanes sp. M2I2]